MKLTAIKRKTEIEDSKIFGQCYVPENWLEGDIFSPFEFFLAQINLNKINCQLTDKKGYLYFFVDAYSMAKGKMVAKVRYTEKEPDAYTDFNDGYFEDDPDEYFLQEEKDGLIDFCEKSGDNKIILLKIKNHFLPQELKSATFCFEISENDLKSGAFEKTTLKLIK